MRYYRTDSGVVSTVGVLPFEEITQDEFDAKMKDVSDKISSSTPAPEPTTEERIADLEVSNAELREALYLILSGGTE